MAKYVVLLTVAPSQSNTLCAFAKISNSYLTGFDDTVISQKSSNGNGLSYSLPSTSNVWIRSVTSTSITIYNYTSYLRLGSILAWK